MVDESRRRGSVSALIETGIPANLAGLTQRWWPSRRNIMSKTEVLSRKLERSARFRPKLDIMSGQVLANVGGKKTIGAWTAVAMIVQQVLSGDVAATPHSYVVLGWFPMLSATLISFSLATMTALMTAKTMTMLPGNQLFEQRYEYVAIVRHFLGEATAWVIEIAFHALTVQSLLAFNDLVKTFDALLLNPLLGYRLSVGWMRSVVPSLIVEPLLTNGSSVPLAERFSIPPWVFQLTLDEKLMESGLSEPTISFSLGYVILGALMIYLCRRNLEDDTMLRSVAIGMTGAAWALLMVICVPRLALWGTMTDWLRAVESSIGWHTSPATLWLRWLVRVPWNLLNRGGKFLKGLGRTARFSWKHLFVATGAISSGGMSSLETSTGVPCENMSPLYRQQRVGEITNLLNVAGVTAVQLNYFSMAPYLGRDNAATMRGLTDTMALGHTCGTCYTDLCFDALEYSTVLICPDPAWAARIRDLRVQKFVESRYQKETTSKPALPAWWLMIPRKFLLFITMAKLWGFTDTVPSLVNEIKEDVNITQTIWRATITALGVTTIIPFIVAVAFPGLVKLTGTSPFALIANNFLPPYASNLLLLAFAFCTIVPGIMTSCMSSRYNLVNTGKLSNRQAIWVTSVLPFALLWLAPGIEAILDVADIFLSLAALLCNFIAPVLCYIAAHNKSPLAVRDEVRKDILRMSITAFKPKHGSMTDIQTHLRHWARYAGARDPQLKLLLRCASPTKRAAVVARLTTRHSVESEGFRTETGEDLHYTRSEGPQRSQRSGSAPAISTSHSEKSGKIHRSISSGPETRRRHYWQSQEDSTPSDGDSVSTTSTPPILRIWREVYPVDLLIDHHRQHAYEGLSQSSESAQGSREEALSVSKPQPRFGNLRLASQALMASSHDEELMSSNDEESLVKFPMCSARTLRTRRTPVHIREEEGGALSQSVPNINVQGTDDERLSDSQRQYSPSPLPLTPQPRVRRQIRFSNTEESESSAEYDPEGRRLSWHGGPRPGVQQSASSSQVTTDEEERRGSVVKFAPEPTKQPDSGAINIQERRRRLSSLGSEVGTPRLTSGAAVLRRTTTAYPSPNLTLSGLSLKVGPSPRRSDRSARSPTKTPIQRRKTGHVILPGCVNAAFEDEDEEEEFKDELKRLRQSAEPKWCDQVDRELQDLFPKSLQRQRPHEKRRRLASEQFPRRRDDFTGNNFDRRGVHNDTHTSKHEPLMGQSTTPSRLQTDPDCTPPTKSGARSTPPTAVPFESEAKTTTGILSEADSSLKFGDGTIWPPPEVVNNLKLKKWIIEHPKSDEKVHVDIWAIQRMALLVADEAGSDKGSIANDSVLDILNGNGMLNEDSIPALIDKLQQRFSVAIVAKARHKVSTRSRNPMTPAPTTMSAASPRGRRSGILASHSRLSVQDTPNQISETGQTASPPVQYTPSIPPIPELPVTSRPQMDSSRSILPTPAGASTGRLEVWPSPHCRERSCSESVNRSVETVALLDRRSSLGRVTFNDNALAHQLHSSTSNSLGNLSARGYRPSFAYIPNQTVETPENGNWVAGLAQFAKRMSSFSLKRISTRESEFEWLMDSRNGNRQPHVLSDEELRQLDDDDISCDESSTMTLEYDYLSTHTNDSANTSSSGSSWNKTATFDQGTQPTMTENTEDNSRPEGAGITAITGLTGITNDHNKKRHQRVRRRVRRIEVFPFKFFVRYQRSILYFVLYWLVLTPAALLFLDTLTRGEIQASPRLDLVIDASTLFDQSILRVGEKGVSTVRTPIWKIPTRRLLLDPLMRLLEEQDEACDS